MHFSCLVAQREMSTIGLTSMFKRSSGPAVADVAVGDPRAVVLALFAEHGTGLYRFCRMACGADDAEDVVQESFLKLVVHLERGGDRSNLRAWLFAVAANGCRDRLRARRRWVPWTAEADRRIVDPEQDAPDHRAVAVALRTLGTRDRLLLGLRAQGLSYREIALASGVREQSVGKLLSRAIDRWKQALNARTGSGTGRR